MRTSQRVGLGMRAAAIALAGALLLAGCATQPEPEQDPFDAATAELRAQLEQIDGIADVRHVLNALDFSISYSITDPARAEQATLEVIDTYEASDVPGALKKETAAYDDDAQLSLNIIEVGAPGGDSGLDPSTSTFAAGLRAPELLNSVDCEPQYVQGSSLNRADRRLRLRRDRITARCSISLPRTSRWTSCFCRRWHLMARCCRSTSRVRRCSPRLRSSRPISTVAGSCATSSSSPRTGRRPIR